MRPILPILALALAALIPARAQNATRSIIEKSNGDILIPSTPVPFLWNDIPARLGILAGSGRHGIYIRSTTETGGAAIIGESQSGSSAGKFLQSGSTLNPSPVLYIGRKDDPDSTSPLIHIKANSTTAAAKLLEIVSPTGTPLFIIYADGAYYSAAGATGLR